MVLFVDRSLGNIDVPDALRAAGATVATHPDHFRDDAPDILWLRIAGHQRWVVLTKDHGIRKRQIERQAIVDGGAKVFFLLPRRLTGAQNGAIFVRALKKIDKLVRGNNVPFIALVYANGAAKIIERPRHG